MLTSSFSTSGSALEWYLPSSLTPPKALEATLEQLQQEPGNTLLLNHALTLAWLQGQSPQQQPHLLSLLQQHAHVTASLTAETTTCAINGKPWGLVQMNPSPGDLQGNFNTIKTAMQWAEALELEGLVFPELALMGYPIRDVIIRFPSLVERQNEHLQQLIALSGNTTVFLGVAEPRPGKVGRPFFNSVVCLQHGKLQGVVRKSLLPTYHEYEEWRTFEPASRPGLWRGEAYGQGAVEPMTQSPLLLLPSGQRVAITICEDSWNQPGLPGRLLYATEPVSTLLEQQPHLWLNLSASVGRVNKEAVRDRLLSQLARRTKAPWLYVNQAGAVDECCFEGTSSLYNASGTLQARGLAYKAQFLLVNPWQQGHWLNEQSLSKNANKNPIYPLPEEGIPEPERLETQTATPVEPSVVKGWRKESHETPQAPPAPPELTGERVASDRLGARLYAGLLTGIENYFQKTGFTCACVGLSGGLDSSVTAVLLADALGAENVLAVTMPSAITPEENQQDAETLASNLGLTCIKLPIEGITQAFLPQGLALQRSALKQAWGEPSPHSFASDNVQAMSRATLLRLIGNDYNALPVATSDKSEFYLGYTTVNGDMSGALAPLGDVTKTRVRLLANWLNHYRSKPNAIPKGIITRPSGADLAINPVTGKPLTAEDALMPYAFADEIIWRLEVLQQSPDHLKTTEFYWEQQNAPLTPEQKHQWLQRFFTRMNRSLFKWWLAPPILLIDEAGSLTKTEYHHPITAGRIAWL